MNQINIPDMTQLITYAAKRLISVPDVLSQTQMSKILIQVLEASHVSLLIFWKHVDPVNM